jgi:hypothetical protein
MTQQNIFITFYDKKVITTLCELFFSHNVITTLCELIFSYATLSSTQES